MTSSQMEQRFNAAVNVIRGLPKNGSYQPSNDMMLRFYSYFKQATLGPCTQKKPPFWDIVSKAKYDSYKSLGNMPKERAMELYVEELKKIIETMSYTDNVAEFMGSISELNGIDFGDLEAVAPDAIKKVRSHPNSPFASREASPIRVPHRNAYVNGISNGATYSANGNAQDSVQNGHSHLSEHSDDEYIDTVEDDTYLINEPIIQSRTSRSVTRRSFGESDPQFREIPTTSNSTNYQQIEPAISLILRTVESMRNDLQQINNRIDIVERSITEVKNHQLRKKVGVHVDINVLNNTTITIAKHSTLKIMALRYPKWWPFTDISPNWFIFMILWPFLARRLQHMLQRKSK